MSHPRVWEWLGRRFIGGADDAGDLVYASGCFVDNVDHMTAQGSSEGKFDGGRDVALVDEA
jgi:hypothetical protein